MLYFFVELHMENQINIENQSFQQIEGNSVDQPAQVLEKPKPNYWVFSIFALTIALVALLLWFFIANKQNASMRQNKTFNSGRSPTVFPTPTDSYKYSNGKQNPKLAVFMREGVIYAKNFNNNQETKVSRTTRVHSPNLSPNGKYIIYFSIIHATGGFPRGDVFIADIGGSFEKRLGSTNEFASKASWSNNGNYLGLVLFPDKNPSSSGFYAEALLYDATTQKDIARSRINLGQDLSNDQYDVNFDCAKLETKYVAFCNEFVAIAKAKQSLPEFGYKADQYRNSGYTKAGYKLSKSYKISDDLVILEYYTGEPKNPESQWGIGGGVFVPGYDDGVTQTYTVLLNEKTNKVITEILKAVDTKFIF